jgi:hypothetical protein
VDWLLGIRWWFDYRWGGGEADEKENE